MDPDEGLKSMQEKEKGRQNEGVVAPKGSLWKDYCGTTGIKQAGRQPSGRKLLRNKLAGHIRSRPLTDRIMLLPAERAKIAPPEFEHNRGSPNYQ